MLKNHLFLDENQKQLLIKEIEKKFKEIINIMSINKVVDNDHIKETPYRISKMFVNEIFKSLYEEPPKIKTFPCYENNNEIMVSKITVKSTCAHHFVPFYGKATVIYKPNKKLTGLSKFSRVIDYFSRMPQIQELLTNQIGQYLVNELEPEKLLVVMRCKHLCMIHRGVNEYDSVTDTYYKYGNVKFDDVLKAFETLPKEV